MYFYFYYQIDSDILLQEVLIMKKVLSTLCVLGTLGVASICYASPFVVTGTFLTDSVTACEIVLNGAAPVSFTPETVDATTSRCAFDLANVPEGLNTLTLRTVNMWGVSDQAPFEFTKRLPPKPSGIRLE